MTSRREREADMLFVMSEAQRWHGSADFDVGVEHPLDHVGIAVPSIAHALPVFESLAGTKSSPVEPVPRQGVNVVFVGSLPCRVELIEPTRDDSPVARFLERRGSGLHHIAYRVPDIEAALASYIARGWDPVDRVPRAGAHGRRVAFLHPRSTHGVLVELVEDAGPVSGA
jgi:methylmalonyl-CoA/ethylmalonyl-CoA epimerase